MKTLSNNSHFLKLSGICFFIFLWTVISYLFRSQTSLFLASPQETLWALFNLFNSSNLLLDMAATFLRTISAFIPAVILGVILGLLLGVSKRLYWTFEVPIEFFRSLPATALLPIFVLAFGISDVARVGIAFFVGFWVVLLNTIYGTTHTSILRKNVALSMHATKLQIFRYVTIWEILPYVFSAMRLAISISLVVVIVAEMIIGPDYGLGIKLFNAQQTFRVDYVYAIILCTGTLGFILNRIVLFAEKRIVHWGVA